jgi:hypothetical protein
MRFTEACEGWNAGRLTQEEAAQLLSRERARGTALRFSFSLCRFASIESAPFRLTSMSYRRLQAMISPVLHDSDDIKWSCHYDDERM